MISSPLAVIHSGLAPFDAITTELRERGVSGLLSFVILCTSRPSAICNARTSNFERGRAE